MDDRDIARLITSSVGYRSTTSPVDRAKVDAEERGNRKPYPSGKLAQAAVELYRRSPGQPPSALSPVWQTHGVFTVSLSSFHGETRRAAWAAGYRTVYVQLLHGLYQEANERELPAVLREGWVPVGWGTYGQGSDPEQDGVSAAAIARRLSLRGWKANGESWAEGEHSWKTEAFLRGWRAGGAPCPLGWSVLSSDTSNYPRRFAYQVALGVEGADIDIQVYGSSFPTLTVAAGLGMLDKAKVPRSRVAMTFDVNNAGNGPFQDYRTWRGPRRVWTGDSAAAHTFQEIG